MVDITTLSCRECGTIVTEVTAVVDPRREHDYIHIAGCGHLISQQFALALWSGGLRWERPKVDGAALMGAERLRQLREEGYTPQHDAEHGDNALAWAAWSYLDRAASGATTEGAPSAWPWDPESFKPGSSAIRNLIIAGALIAAELDRLLAQERQPNGPAAR